MRAQPARSTTIAAPADEARTNVVADWQRQIAQNMGAVAPTETGTDVALRTLSRFTGYGALAFGFVATGWLLFA